MSNQIQSADSTESQAVSASTSGLVGDALISSVASAGLDPDSWNDLCVGAATNAGDSAASFRDRLKADLAAIGISWTSLFCHKQSTSCGYSNAWSWYGSIQMATVNVNGNYYSAFLTY